MTTLSPHQPCGVRSGADACRANAGNESSKPADHEAIGIDHHPFLLNFSGLFAAKGLNDLTVHGLMGPLIKKLMGRHGAPMGLRLPPHTSGSLPSTAAVFFITYNHNVRKW